MTDIVKFDFYGDSLDVSKEGENLYVALRPMCQALGVDPDTQLRKLKTKPWAVTVMMTGTGTDGKRYEMTGLHVDSVMMWLAGIEASKVAEHVRAKLVRYQLECARVLRDHFMPHRASVPMPEPTIVALEIVHGPRLSDVPNLRNEIAGLCAMAARASGNSVGRIHGFVRRTYHVPGVYHVAVVLWPAVRQTIQAVALGELHIGRGPVRRVPTEQLSIWGPS